MVRFSLGIRKNGENKIIVGDWEYDGTPGLWEVIVATTADDKIFANGDNDNYAEIMNSTNSLRINNDESETKQKVNRSWKWKHLLKSIWNENDLYTINGITPSVATIILPCCPVAEAEDILMASKASGNTGIRYELVSFCDELLM